jgi:ribosomal peptide maturation radical SAM protein 1
MSLQTLPSFRVALISMPWAIFSRPSVQLGALKAYLEKEKGIHVATYHPYLEVAKKIGIDTYRTISNNSWAGETLYSPLLFPEKQADAGNIFKKCCPTLGKGDTSFTNLSQELDNVLNQWLHKLPIEKFDLIGFSICFSQLFSSLLAAQKIKQLHKEIPVVIGGSSCTSDVASSLLRHFPQVDYCVNGEGEEPLIKLCHFIAGRGEELPKGILTAQKGAEEGECNHIPDISTLPTPDYGPYFAELQELFPGQPFQPVLPFEFSRGCWWNKCTFCNLNLQWRGYRWKNAEKVLAEITDLSSKHHCLDFTFTDNALPPIVAKNFFQEVAQQKNDLRFFAEIRATTSLEQLSLYRNGGLDHVQVGIEALSSSLLKKLEKGTTAIENIATMKHCSELQIKLEGNLIIEFPGSTQADAQETLDNLDFVLPYSPLTSASFFLGKGSPVAQSPAEYGIHGITNHSYFKKLLPVKLFEKLDLLVKSYRGDRLIQIQQWKPVKEKISRWQDFHLRRINSSFPALSYRDGGMFIVIRQEQIDGPPLIHRLKGLSRQIYLFCSTMRTLEEIQHQFPSLAQKAVLNFFTDLCNKRLLFHENGKVLALAIHASTFPKS